MKKNILFFILVILFPACNILMPLSAQNRPALFQAIADNNIPAAIVLLNNGTDVNELYKKDSALCYALRRDRLAIAELIIESPKVDVNRRAVFEDDYHEWERTPLLLAADKGQTEIVALLLKKGADINVRDSLDGSPLSKGNTPLIMAAYGNYLEIVKILLAHSKKPDVLLQEKEGKTAFWFAVKNENIEMVKLLFENGSKINLPDISGKSVLTETILHKKYDVLDFLIANGADINMADNKAFTPLMEAIGKASGKYSKVAFKYLEKFLTFKPDIDFEPLKNNNGGFSALHLAASYNLADVVKLLLDNGANINIVSLATGGTPLHTAASVNFVNVARYLIKCGAKLEIQDKSGATPLITAIVQGFPEMVQTLIEGGAIINVRSSVNVLVTPLVFAAANMDPFKHKNYLTIINYLLDKKADVNFQSSNGRTALMAAAACSDYRQALEKVELLIARGANPDATNDKGETALMFACGAGNEKAIKLLIGKGAGINLKNGSGESAMSYASRSGNKTIISFLESQGAKPDMPIVRKKIIIDALLGTWQGFHDGLPQALYTIVLRKDSSFDFNSQLTQEALKQYPAGSINPIIASQKGTYTFDNNIMIWDITGAAPASMKWKLEKNMLIIDDKIRLKKVK